MTTVALFSVGVLFLIFGLGFLSSYLVKYEATQSGVIASINVSAETHERNRQSIAGTILPNVSESAKVSLGESGIEGLPNNRVAAQAVRG